jgi:hypothetical protein
MLEVGLLKGFEVLSCSAYAGLHSPETPII